MSIEEEVRQQWNLCTNLLAIRYMDIENGKNLKIKLQVLRALNQGLKANEIKDFRKVVKLPKA